MEKKVNPKQRKFIKEYIKTGNATQSVLKAGYKTKNPEVSASQLLRNANVQDEIKNVLDKAGLTDEYLAEGLKFAIEKGLASERRTLSDGIRSIELAARLKDKFPAERKEIATQSLHLSLKGKSIEELEREYKALIEDAKEFNRKLIE